MSEVPTVLVTVPKGNRIAEEDVLAYVSCVYTYSGDDGYLDIWRIKEKERKMVATFPHYGWLRVEMSYPEVETENNNQEGNDNVN